MPLRGASVNASSGAAAVVTAAARPRVASPIILKHTQPTFSSLKVHNDFQHLDSD